MSSTRYQAKPCADCPWRIDAAAGQFPRARFIALAETAYDMSLTIFACHKSIEGEEIGCAGFAMNGAVHNLGFRLWLRHNQDFVITTDTPLHPDFRTMAIANGVPARHPALTLCR